MTNAAAITTPIPLTEPKGADGAVRVVDPASEPVWDGEVGALPGASFFHGAAWARVLTRTYGHQPLYLCEQGPGGLKSVLPLMEVSSPLTGRRGVCLPFTDVCPALMTDPSAAGRLLARALELGRERGWRYLELRGTEELLKAESGKRKAETLQSNIEGSDPAVPHSASGQPSTFNLQPSTSVSFLSHTLDLRPGPEALLKGMDQGARRAIKKAQQSGVQIEIQRQPDAMLEYFRLHCLTRKRHGLPPQPWRFFENLGQLVLGHDGGFVALARYLGQPIAAAVFVHAAANCEVRSARCEAPTAKSAIRNPQSEIERPSTFNLQPVTSSRSVIYKYGASDESFQGVRPNNLLFWHVMQECCSRGFESMHFGRSSAGNEGLCRFKRSLGAVESSLDYARYDFGRSAWVTSVDRAEGSLNSVFRMLPVGVLRLMGRILYPHLS
jgi:hypothetical protein